MPGVVNVYRDCRKIEPDADCTFVGKDGFVCGKGKAPAENLFIIFKDIGVGIVVSCGDELACRFDDFLNMANGDETAAANLKQLRGPVQQTLKCFFCEDAVSYGDPVREHREKAWRSLLYISWTDFI